MLVPQFLAPKSNNNSEIANQCLSKILVVDDEPLICQLYRELLTEAGFTVDIARDGASAWTALQSKKYDLVITDNQMPILSGMDLLVKIHNAQMQIPVILASGTLPPNNFARLPWRPTIFLMKPYGPEELMGAVRQVLNPAKAVKFRKQFFYQ